MQRGVEKYQAAGCWGKDGQGLCGWDGEGGGHSQANPGSEGRGAGWNADDYPLCLADLVATPATIILQ